MNIGQQTHQPLVGIQNEAKTRFFSWKGIAIALALTVLSSLFLLGGFAPIPLWITTNETEVIGDDSDVMGDLMVHEQMRGVPFTVYHWEKPCAVCGSTTKVNPVSFILNFFFYLVIIWFLFKQKVFSSLKNTLFFILGLFWLVAVTLIYFVAGVLLDSLNLSAGALLQSQMGYFVVIFVSVVIMSTIMWNRKRSFAIGILLSVIVTPGASASLINTLLEIFNKFI